MSGRGWLLLAALALSCRSGLGEPCDGQAPCPAELECRVPPNDGGLDSGVCDHRWKREGERCASAAECEPQLTCSSHFAPGTRYGSCVPKRADGEPCFSDRDCSGGKCEGKSGAAVDGTCAKK